MFTSVVLIVTLAMLVGIAVVCSLLPPNGHRDYLAAAPLITLGRDSATLPQLRGFIQQDFRAEDYAQARHDLALLQQHYPTQAQTRLVLAQRQATDSLFQLATQRATAKQARQVQREAAGTPPLVERWGRGTYTDEFGDRTGNQFVANVPALYGQWDRAGRTVPLRITLMADSASALYLDLATESVVPGSSRHSRRWQQHRLALPPGTRYTVDVRDDQGRTSYLQARSADNLVALTTRDSRTLHQLLENGGHLRFVVTQVGAPAVRYRFAFSNTDQYELAYKHLLQP